MQEKKPSETIHDFIDFLNESKALYEQAKKKCEEYDSMERHVYWAHRIEFAKDKAERNRLATAMQREQRERRKYKDICDTYRVIYDFINSDNNKSTLKRMNGMVSIQKKQEDYLESERNYKGGDKNEQ